MKTAVAADESEVVDEMLMHLATALELIHNASLVHDDIIDGSSIRRDLPTLNRTYSNHIALLAGDALFSQAFYIMARNMERRVIEPITLVTAGMCHGEIINAVSEGGGIDFPTYLAIVKLKTASLMSVSTQTGAMVTGAGEKTVQIMADYGMSMGIAYQMVDDYVDEEIGRVKGYSLDYALESAEKARKVLARFIRQGLTEAGYAVDVAADGAEGAAFARVGNYDLLIVDIMLPELSGLDLLKEGRRQTTPHRMYPANNRHRERYE